MNKWRVQKEVTKAWVCYNVQYRKNLFWWVTEKVFNHERDAISHCTRLEIARIREKANRKKAKDSKTVIHPVKTPMEKSNIATGVFIALIVLFALGVKAVLI